MQSDDPSLFLATAPADRREVHFALAAVLASTAIFIASLPYSTVKLAAVPAFIPAYESALIVCDLITAVLLFGQFRFLRLPGLLVLASGYLFTAAIAFVHALTFPGVFSSTGLLGAGTQSTAWLYIVWHAGFPVFVLAYAALKRQAPSRSGREPTCQRPREQCDPGQRRRGLCFGLRGRGPGDRRS